MIKFFQVPVLGRAPDTLPLSSKNPSKAANIRSLMFSVIAVVIKMFRLGLAATI